MTSKAPKAALHVTQASGSMQPFHDTQQIAINHKEANVEGEGVRCILLLLYI